MGTDQFIKGEARRVPIQGRVDIKALAEVCLYFEQMGHTPRTRSELIAMAVEGLAYLARINGRINHVQTANDANRLLEARHMGWRPGSRSHKDVMRVIGQEELDVNDLQDVSRQERLREYEEIAKQQLKKRARKGTGDGIAGLDNLPDNVIKKEDK